MKYHYYAVFEKDEDGYSISFPDLPGCLTCAKDIEEALKMAKDVLEGYMLISEEDNDPIEPASSYKELNKKRELEYQEYIVDLALCSDKDLNSKMFFIINTNLDTF